MRFELLEWRDRKYRHVKFVQGTKEEAKKAEKRMNEGYTGPRFVIREVKA